MEEWARNVTGATLCEKCNDYIFPGHWPFCPHPLAKTAGMIPDEIPGGITLENLGPEPVTVYSMSEYHRIRKERGLEMKEKFSPFPGTDVDPSGVQNPEGYIDKYTLDNRAELFLRGNSRHHAESPDPTVTSGAMTEEEARGYLDS